MKKIIIIILLAVGSIGIMGFTLTKKGTNNLTTKTTEEINPLPKSLTDWRLSICSMRSNGISLSTYVQL
jgi:hypothetical protein